MMVINLTQHPASKDQIDAGVIDLPAAELRALKKLLTVDKLPSLREIDRRAERIANLADVWIFHRWPDERNVRVMIGGAPWLMSALERRLLSVGLVPVYAFSRRESVETTLKDGSIKKTQVFRHLGFVDV